MGILSDENNKRSSQNEIKRTWKVLKIQTTGDRDAIIVLFSISDSSSCFTSFFKILEFTSR